MTHLFGYSFLDYAHVLGRSSISAQKFCNCAHFDAVMNQSAQSMPLTAMTS